MAVTTDPEVEAVAAIVDRINSGTVFTQAFTAIASDHAIDALENVRELRVDVVPESQETLADTLAIEDRSSHLIRVWIRKKLSRTRAELDMLKLFGRQVFQRLNNFDSSDGRVKVWEAEMDSKEGAVKEVLRQAGLFVTSILLRVEVSSS